MILSTAIRRFDEQLRAEGKSPVTRKAYLRDLRLLEAFLGTRSVIASVTPHVLTRFVNSPAFAHTSHGRMKAATSLNRSKTAVRTFFRFLTDARYIKRNPARLIRRSRTVSKPPSYLSVNETDRLLRTVKKRRTPISHRDHTIFSLLLGTGIRLGALVALNIDDVNLSQSVLRVKEKGGVERYVFLSSSLKTVLRSILRDRLHAHEPLFLSNRRERLGARQVQLRLEYWRQQVGIQRRFTVHTLRHTFANRLYEQTGDLRLVQQALGHRHVSTTEIYTHLSDLRLKRALKSMKI